MHEQLSLGTFLVIDIARFDALPDAAFLELRRAGRLRPIYAHLRSQQNWQALTDRVAALVAAGWGWTNAHTTTTAPSGAPTPQPPPASA